MGVFRRITDATRASLNDLRSRTVRRDDRPLDELSDKELEEEIIRRRRERAKGREQPETRRKAEASPQEKQLAQYYANLELQPGATLEDVKKAYRELMRKYHPDKFLGDPEKHRAATELAQSLTEAYQKLSARLSSR